MIGLGTDKNRHRVHPNPLPLNSVHWKKVVWVLHLTMHSTMHVKSSAEILFLAPFKKLTGTRPNGPDRSASWYLILNHSSRQCAFIKGGRLGGQLAYRGTSRVSQGVKGSMGKSVCPRGSCGKDMGSQTAKGDLQGVPGKPKLIIHGSSDNF